MFRGVPSLIAVALASSAGGGADEVPRLRAGEFVSVTFVPPHADLAVRFAATGGAHYALLGSSVDCDVAVAVRDGNDVEIARADGGGIASDAVLDWRVPATGDYRVVLSARKGASGTGTLLALRAPFDPTVADPAAAERDFWERAIDSAESRGDAARAEQAERELANLERDTGGAAARLARKLARDELSAAIDAVTAAADGMALGAALVRLEGAVDGATKDPSPSGAASRLLDRAAGVATAEGSFELALRAAEGARMLGAALFPTDSLERARLEVSLGDARAGLRDVAAAREHHDRALAILDRVADPDCEERVRALHNRGLASLTSGDLAAAAADLEQVVDAVERTGSGASDRARHARLNLALARIRTGRTLEARSILTRLLPELEREAAASRGLLRQAQLLLGIACADLGDSARALQFAGSALASAERDLPAGHPELQSIQHNLAQMLAAADRYEEALPILEQILAAREAALQDSDPRVQNARIAVARAAAHVGDSVRCADLFQRACAVLEAGLPETAAALADARARHAASLWQCGDFAAAERAIAPLLEPGAAAPATRAGGLTIEMSAARIYSALGDVERARAMAAVAAEQLSDRLDGARGLPARARRELAHDAGGELATLLAVLRDLPADAALTRRLFELAEIRRILATGDGGRAGAGANSARLAAARAELSALAAPAPVTSDTAARAARVAALSALIDQLEDQAAGGAAAAGQELRAVDCAALAAALGPREALVTYCVCSARRPNARAAESFLFAFVLDAGGGLAALNLGPLPRVEAAIDAWRAAVHPSGTVRGIGRVGDRGAALEPAGEELRRRLLDPVLAAAGDVRTLHVCRDGAPALVPLDALPYGSGVVGDRFEIRVETSVQHLLAPAPPVAGPPELLAVAAVDYGEAGASLGEAFEALPATGAEAAAVAAAFAAVPGAKTTLLSGAAATRDAWIREAPSARFLHLATHGWSALKVQADAGALAVAFAELAPLALCGLAFAGANQGTDLAGRAVGIATGEDVVGLDLTRCELAVLSSCDSASGLARSGMGSLSLAAALHSAGARSVVSSLWKVDDDAARALMAEFYRRLFELGESKAQALWNAKLALRDAGAPLAAWAGWVLSGEAE